MWFLNLLFWVLEAISFHMTVWYWIRMIVDTGLIAI